MRKLLLTVAILFSINSFSQPKKDTAVVVTDSLEFLSVTDLSIALYKSGQILSEKLTKKEWDEVMAILQKEFLAQINVAEQRLRNRKKVK